MARFSYDDAPDGNDWIFNPDLAAMNRAIENELREDAYEMEYIMAQSELRSRTFAEVAREIRNRGDHVTIVVSHRSFTGSITFAAGDFVTITTPELEADVHLADVAYMRSIRKGQQGGREVGDGPGTFAMRLLEKESTTTKVEIGFAKVEATITGSIKAVTQDHVLIIDANRSECVAPISGISYVIRRSRTAYR